MNHRELIEQYINGWLENNTDKILDSLSPNIVIIESHGPRYSELEKVEEWMRSWIKEGNRVNRWDIKSFYKAKGDGKVNVCFIEWTFECIVKGEKHLIEGLSIIKYKDSKITYIREYKTSKPIFDWNI